MAKEADDKRNEILKELQAVRQAMCAATPGKPAVFIPLEQVFTFKSQDGVQMAVVPVEQVIYLVDEILRGRP